MDEDAEDTPLMEPETLMFEQPLHNMRTIFEYESVELELEAIEACMHDVGWLSNNYEHARATLEPVVWCRLVQPLAVSGPNIRKEFVFPGVSSTSSLAEKAQRDEHVDLLDTAEW